MADPATSAADGKTHIPCVVTQFSGGYTPPFNVEDCVARMLHSVPEKYLLGLSEVVLTNTAGLARRQRRAMTLSRKRKVRQAAALGLYHQAWKNRPAWIQIYVDNILRNWESGWWLHLRFYREMLIGNVLFHELGHHIHYAIRPEHREREDVADVWKVSVESKLHEEIAPSIAKLHEIHQIAD
jgi:hypothetical protein